MRRAAARRSSPPRPRPGVELDGLFVEPARIDLGGRQRLTLLSLVRAGGVVDAEMAARRPDVQGGEQRFLARLNGLLGAGTAVVLTVPERRARVELTDFSPRRACLTPRTARSDAEATRRMTQTPERPSRASESPRDTARRHRLRELGRRAFRLRRALGRARGREHRRHLSALLGHPRARRARSIRRG